MLKSACEGSCSDKGYLGGFSRNIGFGIRFEIGIGIRIGFGFGVRFGLRIGFGIPLRDLLQRICRTLIE